MLVPISCVIGTFTIKHYTFVLLSGTNCFPLLPVYMKHVSDCIWLLCDVHWRALNCFHKNIGWTQNWDKRKFKFCSILQKFCFWYYYYRNWLQGSLDLIYRDKISCDDKGVFPDFFCSTIFEFYMQWFLSYYFIFQVSDIAT